MSERKNFVEKKTDYRDKSSKKSVIIISSIIIVIILGVVAFLVVNQFKKVAPVVDDDNDFTLDLDLTQIRLQKLKEAKTINEKVYGFISVEGTNIEYPVVFDEENDNAYWETKTLEGVDVTSTVEEIFETVVYASRETKFLEKEGNLLGSMDYGIDENASKNLVVYGHNWNNLKEPLIIGNEKPEEYTMFAQLPSYTDIDFASQNQLIYFTTMDQERVYQVFSVMYTEPSWFDELGVEYIEENPTDEQMKVIAKEMQKRSIFNFDINVTDKDSIITLSTCTRVYPENRENQRFVVSGKLLSQEDIKEDIKVNINENVKEPTF